jgi:hypothetical protein
MAIAFRVVTWVTCLAILGVALWVVSWLPALVLFAAAPLLPRMVVTWLESPVARLVCAAAFCAWMLWYDAYVWPRRAAELLRKSGF